MPDSCVQTDLDPIVLVWSGEYRMWWRPCGYGYTPDRDLAGRWYLGQAMAMTEACSPEKQLVLQHAKRPERPIETSP